MQKCKNKKRILIKDFGMLGLQNLVNFCSFFNRGVRMNTNELNVLAQQAATRSAREDNRLKARNKSWVEPKETNRSVTAVLLTQDEDGHLKVLASNSNVKLPSKKYNDNVQQAYFDRLLETVFSQGLFEVESRNAIHINNLNVERIKQVIQELLATDEFQKISDANIQLSDVSPNVELLNQFLQLDDLKLEKNEEKNYLRIRLCCRLFEKLLPEQYQKFCDTVAGNKTIYLAARVHYREYQHDFVTDSEKGKGLYEKVETLPIVQFVDPVLLEDQTGLTLSSDHNTGSSFVNMDELLDKRPIDEYEGSLIIDAIVNAVMKNQITLTKIQTQQLATIKRKLSTVDLDPQTTISLWVDPQNIFSILEPRQLPVKGAAYSISHLNDQHAFVDKALRFASQDLHSPQHLCHDHKKAIGSATRYGSDVPHFWGQTHAEIGTTSCLFMPGLEHQGSTVIVKGTDIKQHGYGAFCKDNPQSAEEITPNNETGLDAAMLAALRSKHHTPVHDETLRADSTLIIGGLALDYCVKTTALQAVMKGYQRVIVNLPACKAINADTAQKAILEMADAGVMFIVRPQALNKQIEVVDASELRSYFSDEKLQVPQQSQFTTPEAYTKACTVYTCLQQAINNSSQDGEEQKWLHSAANTLKGKIDSASQETNLESLLSNKKDKQKINKNWQNFIAAASRYIEEELNPYLASTCRIQTGVEPVSTAAPRPSTPEQRERMLFTLYALTEGLTKPHDCAASVFYLINSPRQGTGANWKRIAGEALLVLSLTAALITVSCMFPCFSPEQWHL